MVRMTATWPVDFWLSREAGVSRGQTKPHTPCHNAHNCNSTNNNTGLRSERKHTISVPEPASLRLTAVGEDALLQVRKLRPHT